MENHNNSSGSTPEPSLSKRIGNWTKYTQAFLATLEPGDLIQFNRISYSHWAIYVKNGLVCHFHYVDLNVRVGLVDLYNFVPGIVTIDSLEDVAGTSEVRVNNKPGSAFPLTRSITEDMEVRPLWETVSIINTLKDVPGLSYCLAYFNSEHFATFLKFREHSGSAQIGDIRMAVAGWKRGSERVSKAIRKETELNRLAYLQWIENIETTERGEVPKNLLQDGVSGLEPELVKYLSQKWQNLQR